MCTSIHLVSRERNLGEYLGDSSKESSKTSMVYMDGSYGEGGGQIVRSALSLAALRGEEVRIERIRQGRQRPGLAAQHLTGVRMLAQICEARLEGASLGSRALPVWPGRAPKAGRYHFDVSQARRGGSAGAVSLILQAVLLPLAQAAGSSRLVGEGGTHVAWSPPFHYLESVWLPMLARSGVEARVSLERWGWYPQGGGKLTCEVKGQGGEARPSCKGMVLEERGRLMRLRGISASSNLPRHIAQRQRRRVEELLREQGLAVELQTIDAPSPGQGTMVFLLAESENSLAGFTAYGRKGKPAEKVAEEAVTAFMEYHRSGAAVDPHLADQLVLPLALAEGESSFTTSRITRHLLTNIWVVGQMLEVHFSVEGQEGEPGRVKVQGIGGRGCSS